MTVEDGGDDVLDDDDEGSDNAGEESASGDGLSREVWVEEAEEGWRSTSRRESLGRQWAVILPCDSTSWMEPLCLTCFLAIEFLVDR